jgi:hypothetical protein
LQGFARGGKIFVPKGAGGVVETRKGGFWRELFFSRSFDGTVAAPLEPPNLSSMKPLPKTFLPVALVLGVAFCMPAFAKEKGKRKALREKGMPEGAQSVETTEEPEVPQEKLDLMHVWSDSEGRRLEAEFRRLDGDSLEVRARDGKVYRLSLAKLVEADRLFAGKLQQQQPPSVKESAAKIDALVLEGLTKAGKKPNPPATDEQFVRRVYLDLAGRIPTAAETAAFLGDKREGKRGLWVDALLAGPGYGSQMFNWMADTLRIMDDYGKGVKTYLYEEWVKEQLAMNRPWDKFVYDLMTAEGRLSDTGPVGYLLRDRGMPLDNLSNTLGTFLGANVACAQCHNHPLADWKERDFYGMAAFFGNTDTTYAKATGVAKRMGKTADVDKNLLIRILAPNLAEVETVKLNAVKLPEDYKYKDGKPGDSVEPKLIAWTEQDRATPLYQGVKADSGAGLRKQFAKWMTHPENPRFATAIANRMWKKLFGLGVQEPVSDLDDLSKGANPELLAGLTDLMRRERFDLKEFQRVLVNTQAYQRQVSVTPDLSRGAYLFPGPLLRRMSAEQAWDSVLALVIGTEIDGFKLQRAEHIREVDLPGAVTQEAVLAKAHELLGSSGNGAAQGRGGGKKKLGGNGDLRSSDFGDYPPPHFEGMTLARASELPQPSRESHFLRMFGQSDRQVADSNSTEGGVPQVLMLMNGDVQKVIASQNSKVLKEAAKEKGVEKQVESLYFSFLGRRPALSERQYAVNLLGNGLKLPDLAWVMFNTREFMFVQ